MQGLEDINALDAAISRAQLSPAEEALVEFIQLAGAQERHRFQEGEPPLASICRALLATMKPDCSVEAAHDPEGLD